MRRPNLQLKKSCRPQINDLYIVMKTIMYMYEMDVPFIWIQ